jgi:hypothetical protein
MFNELVLPLKLVEERAESDFHETAHNSLKYLSDFSLELKLNNALELCKSRPMVNTPANVVVHKRDVIRSKALTKVLTLDRTIVDQWKLQQSGLFKS